MDTGSGSYLVLIGHIPNSNLVLFILFTQYNIDIYDTSEKSGICLKLPYDVIGSNAWIMNPWYCWLS